MGNGVLAQAADSGVTNATVIVTPLPVGASSGPYGPNWRSAQTLAAAPDPGFPDPRIPPKPLPTPIRPTPSPTPKWTPNPGQPIWEQTVLPSPSPTASPTESPAASATP